MKKTLQDQYLLIKEGKGHKGVFLNEAKHQFPNIVRNAATFEEAVASLQTKNIISENVIGLTTVAGYEPRKKESYETAFEAFLAEAKKKENEDEKVKAEEKKVSKPVEKDLEKNFDYSDEKNPDNMIFGQIMMGYYAEMKDPKNSEKTMEELKDMVFKNLAKDPIYYTKNAQFGVKDLGYTDEAPALGMPKEAKGKYKSSGYGDLNEAQDKDVARAFKNIGDAFSAEPKKSGKSADELKAIIDKQRKEREEKLRKVVREMIDDELEEAYQLKNINIKAVPKEPKGEPQENAKYISIPDGIMKTLIERGYIIVEEDGVFVSGTFIANVDKLLKYDDNSKEKIFFSNKSVYSPDKETKTNIYTLAKDPSYRKIIAPNGVEIRSSKLPEFRTNDEGDTKVVPPVDSKLLFQAIITPEAWRTFTRKSKDTIKGLMESVEKDLADINKEAEHEVLQAKLDKIDVLIDKRRSQLGKLDEDEDMKALTDKKKVKELEKDIKKLEQARGKVEKMMSKFKGKKAASKEVIDEMDNDEENIADDAPGYIEDANKRLRDGEEIDSIISNYPNLSDKEQDDLRNYLEFQKGSDIGQDEELDTYEF